MLEFLAKGKRGIVYADKLKGFVVKKPNPNSEANNRLEIEAKFLQLLNQHNIGPKFIGFQTNRLSMEYIEGERIVDYFKNPKTRKKQICSVLKQVFAQLHKMDALGINKQELTNPYKHIMIKDQKPVMIDFERCRYSNNPKNVTQFMQFLCSEKIQEVLRKKGIFFDKKKILLLAAAYKKNRKIEPKPECFWGFLSSEAKN